MIQMWLYSIPHPMAYFLAGIIGGRLSDREQHRKNPHKTL